MHASRTSTVIGLALAGLVGLAHGDDPKPTKPPTAPIKQVPAPVKPVPPAPPAPPPTPKPVAPAPTPSTAVADYVKAMKGTWKCSGHMLLPDGTELPNTGTLTVKLDLDKFWAHTTYAPKGKQGYRFESYRTLDPVSGKWHQILIDNVGGQEVGTSAGPEGSKLVWLTDARGPNGSRKSRHTEQKSGTDVVLWGETSMDGKLWIKSYEVTCKK